MDTLNFPTKRNLLLARSRLALARKGYDLLDKKRLVLIQELGVTQGQANHIWEELLSALQKAKTTLSFAYMEMGQDRVRSVSSSIPKNTVVGVSSRSIMGAELPLMKDEDIGYSKNIGNLQHNGYLQPSLSYNLHETTSSLDETALAWQQARQLIVAWAAIENTLHILNLHIKKTQKRANALGNITIPKYEAQIKYIEERLEERERDELARLKLVKSKTLNQLHP